MTANGKARFGLDFTNDSEILELLDEFANEESEILSSLLEPPETTQAIDSKLTYRGRFMAGKEKEYRATEEAYEEMYQSPSNSHLLGIRECRKYATFAREKVSGDVKIMASSCRDRWCPMCAGQKSAYAKDNTEIYTKSLTAPRFLTLTLRNNEADLKTQIEFLQDCFRKLRYRAYWKKNVTGGIWFLQVKRGRDSGCWHPHFHILLDGNYMEQKRLSELWELVTFGSPVIDIRRIHNVESAASYVARYTARPAVLADMSLADRIEIIKALQGKRLCGTFGNAKSVTLTPPKIKDSSEWQQIGFYDQVIRDAATKPAARAVLDAYNQYEPLSETAFENYTGHPVHYEIKECYREKVTVQLLLDFYNSS